MTPVLVANPCDPAVLWAVAKETMPLYIDNAKSYAGLAGAALGLTIIFREKVIGETGTIEKSFSLFTCWACFVVTIFFSAFYQWMAVRWIEMRINATYGLPDTRFPLGTVIKPSFVYGAMLFFFFVGAVILLISSTHQLLRRKHPIPPPPPVPAPPHSSRRPWVYALATLAGMVVVTFTVQYFISVNTPDPCKTGTAAPVTGAPTPAAAKQNRQE
jgi:hypothetical protein